MGDYIKTVLWVDDEVEKLDQIIEDFNEEGIGIHGVTNAKDAIEILRDAPTDYEAIILDALFHFDSSDSSEVAETRAGLRKFLTIYNDDDKIKHIPVFVYSGRVDINFLNVEEEFKQSGIEKVYEKANKESFKSLVQDILSSNVNYLSSRFPELNKAIKNLDFSYDEIEILNTSLLFIYKNEDVFYGNALRQIIEKLFTILFHSNIVPKEVIYAGGKENEKNLNAVYFFLRRYYEDTHNNKNYYVSEEIRNVDGHKSFVNNFNNIRETLNAESHYVTINNVIHKESERAKISIVILQVIEVIHWVNELRLIKENGLFLSDEMWSIRNINVISHRGKVEKDSNGHFHCGEYCIFPPALENNGIVEGDEILIEKFDINGDFKTKYIYPKFTKSIIKV